MPSMIMRFTINSNMAAGIRKFATDPKYSGPYRAMLGPDHLNVSKQAWYISSFVDYLVIYFEGLSTVLQTFAQSVPEDDTVTNKFNSTMQAFVSALHFSLTSITPGYTQVFSYSAPCN